MKFARVLRMCVFCSNTFFNRWPWGLHPRKIEMFFNPMVECIHKTKTHRNNDDNNGSLKQLLDCNGTECDKPDRGTTSAEIHPRLLWREMFRYGRRTERHDTLRTLLQQLRISDIFNADHGVQ